MLSFRLVKVFYELLKLQLYPSVTTNISPFSIIYIGIICYKDRLFTIVTHLRSNTHCLVQLNSTFILPSNEIASVESLRYSLVLRMGPSEIVKGRQIEIPSTRMLINVENLEWQLDWPSKKNPTETLKKSSLEKSPRKYYFHRIFNQIEEYLQRVIFYLYINLSYSSNIISIYLRPRQTIIFRQSQIIENKNTYSIYQIQNIPQNFIMFPHRTYIRKASSHNTCTKQQLLWETLNHRKKKLQYISNNTLNHQEEQHILNWCECVINQTIQKPFNASVVVHNYQQIQKIWKQVKTDEGKTRKSIIRLKLFTYCINGNDKELNAKISSIAGSVQNFLKSLTKQQWFEMTKKVNINILLQFWWKQGLINKKDLTYFKDIGKKALNSNWKQPSIMTHPLHPSLVTINSFNTNKNNSILSSQKKDNLSRRSRESRNSQNSRNSIKNLMNEPRRSSIQDRLNQALQQGAKDYSKHRKSCFSNQNQSNYIFEVLQRQMKNQNFVDVIQSQVSQSMTESVVSKSQEQKIFYLYLIIQRTYFVVQIQQNQSQLVLFLKALGIVYRRSIYDRGQLLNIETFCKSIHINKTYKGHNICFNENSVTRYTNNLSPSRILSAEYIYCRYSFKQWIWQSNTLKTVLYSRFLDIAFQQQLLQINDSNFKLKNIVPKTALKPFEIEEYDNNIFQSNNVWCPDIQQSKVQLLISNKSITKIQHTNPFQLQIFNQINNKYNIKLLPFQIYMATISGQCCRIKIIDAKKHDDESASIKIRISYGFHINQSQIPERSIGLSIQKHQLVHCKIDLKDVLKIYRLCPTYTYSKLKIIKGKYDLQNQKILSKIVKRWNREYYVVTIIYKQIINKIIFKAYWQNKSTYLQTILDLDAIQDLKNKNPRIATIQQIVSQFIKIFQIKVVSENSYVQYFGKSTLLEMVFQRKFIRQNNHIYEQKCFIKQNSIKSYPLDLISKTDLKLSRIYYTSMVKDYTESIQLKPSFQQYFKVSKLLNPIKQTPPKISQYRFCRADIQSVTKNFHITKDKDKKKQNIFYKIIDGSITKFKIQKDQVSIKDWKGHDIFGISHQTLKNKVPFYDQLLSTNLKLSKKRIHLSCQLVQRFL